MTVTSAANKQVFAGNGAQVAFAFAFNSAWDGTAANLSAALANFSVLFTDASGNQTMVAQGSGATQCQIALNAPVGSALWGLGGSVTYNPNGVPIATGSTLTIIRALTLEQLVSLQNQASYGQLAASFEKAVDLLEMQTQQEAELYGRAIVVNPADANAPLPLPPAAQRAGLALVFDVNGNPIAGQAPAAGTISSAMAPVVSAASLAAGRTALGLGSMAQEAIGAAGTGLADDGAGNARALEVTSQVSTNQAVTAAFHKNRYIASGPLNFTLPRANTLFNGFGFFVHIVAGTVTFVPDSHDTIAATPASGTSIAIPAPAVVWIGCDAATAGNWYPDVAKASPTQQRLTAGTGATYTTALGATRLRIRMAGGGAGGGGTGSTGAAGGTGGATTFGGISAAGGTGGNGAGAAAAGVGGAGGTGGTGAGSITDRFVGAPGGSGAGAATNPGGGGTGGNSPFLGAGLGGINTVVAATAAAANSGSGGGGGGNDSTHGAGGGGGSGEFVELTINAPLAATYTYTIGAGGTAGAGNTQTGAAGGSGLVIVDEFYD